MNSNVTDLRDNQIRKASKPLAMLLAGAQVETSEKTPFGP